MGIVVHGWRIYHVHKALTQGGELPVLVGGRRQEVHGRVSPTAVCLGFDPYSVWLDQDALDMPHEERHPPGSPAPQFHCSCGYYGHRLWPQDPETGVAVDPAIVFIHATVIGRAILHPDGWRGAAIRHDYIIPVQHVPVPLGRFIQHQYGPPDWEDVWFDEVVAGISRRTSIPILPFDHEEACSDCQEANREVGKGPTWNSAYLSGKLSKEVKPDV